MPPSTLPSKAAASDARYEAIRTLGQGGAGAVYLARDRDTGEVIALKKLLRMDPKSIARLKREFRSLADIHHRNLVQLYDLGCADDGWFLTMEYIDGTDLLEYLGRESRALAAVDTNDTRELRSASVEITPEDLTRTLSAFHQLATGISAVHRAGMLHRDLKPSNVLVGSGRVVVLDFGLVRGLETEDVALTQDGVIAGTPAYMAPEQASAKPLGEGADWYAFGVMLYEALSGDLPIDGRTAMELIVRKSTVDPVPLSRVAPRLPPELLALTDGLLRRDPAERTTGEEVLRVLEQLLGRPAANDTQRIPLDMSFTTQTHAQAHGAKLQAIVGRRDELAALEDALDDMRENGALTVHVRGASGAGKTTLVQTFVDQLESGTEWGRMTEPLVLRSRCNEREAMPFKALDGVMDALVQHLFELTDFDLGRILPVDISELAQLFPELQRIASVRRLVDSEKTSGDALQVRVRAAVALRELFTRLAARRPLVLWIDDLQWGDLDSTNILKAWPEQLASSHILLILSYRSAEMDTSPCLRSLLGRASMRPPPAAARDRIIQVNSLGADDVRRLCEGQLGPTAQERDDLVERIVKESQGNPFLVLQLAALVRAKLTRGDTDLGAISIEQLVDQTTELLPIEARRALSVLAIAGRPMEPKLVLRAAGVQSEGRSLLQALRRLRLIRTRNVGGNQLLEVYHDRVRESVQEALDSATRKQVHADLLAVLESDSDSDPNWLHSLALEAGQTASALRYGLSAAARAEAALAFERAAELYRLCIDMQEPSAETVRLRVRLADALARGGHGVRAAEAYIEAAKYLEPNSAVRCLRFAASHFMRTGEWARSEATVREVFDALNLKMPNTDAGVIAAIAWERTALRLRGYDFEQTKEPVPPELVQTITFYGTLSIEYQAFDPLRAALFQARHMRAALASAEAVHVIRALCSEAVGVCVSGSDRAARRAEELLQRAEALASQAGRESSKGSTNAARAVCAYFLGRATDVLEPSLAAERYYRSDPGGDSTGDYFHRFVVVAVRIGMLTYLGQNQRALAELDRSREEARATNNFNAKLQLTLCESIADGLDSRYEDSRKRLEEERKLLPPGRFGPLHVLHMIAVMRTGCGLHDYAWADRFLEEDWARWEASVVRRSAFLSMLALGTHARYLVNRHVVEGRSDDVRELLRPDMRGIARLPYEDARTPLRMRTEGRLAIVRGDRATALAGLRLGAEYLRNAGALGEFAREQYAIGLLLGGDEGAALCAESEHKLRDMAYSDPLGEVYSHYPELRGAR